MTSFAGRLDEEINDCIQAQKRRKKLKQSQNSFEFQLQVIEAAKKTSYEEQARIHNIPESIIRKWENEVQNGKSEG